jgi:hypothetical protein
VNFDEHWLDHGDKKTVISSLSITTFSSFSQSSKRSQSKRGTKKMKSLGNGVYENSFKRFLSFGDGREYIVTKEEYDG